MASVIDEWSSRGDEICYKERIAKETRAKQIYKKASHYHHHRRIAIRMSRSSIYHSINSSHVHPTSYYVHSSIGHVQPLRKSHIRKSHKVHSTTTSRYSPISNILPLSSRRRMKFVARRCSCTPTIVATPTPTSTWTPAAPSHLNLRRKRKRI